LALNEPVKEIGMQSKGKLKRSDQNSIHLSLASGNLDRRFGDRYVPRLRVNKVLK